MKRIAHITDIHLDEDFPKEIGVDTAKNWSQILESLQGQEIDEIFFTGDIGSAASNNAFFTSLKPFQDRLKITLGNHDAFSEATKYYANSMAEGEQELYYFSEDLFFQYFFFDSSSNRISRRQLDWFKAHAGEDKGMIIFLHHPLIANHSKMDELHAMENRNELTEILKNLDREVHVFCGHYHMDDLTTEDNIHQQITVAASYQIEKRVDAIETNSTSFGYRIIEVDKGRVSSQLVNFPQNHLY